MLVATTVAVIVVGLFVARILWEIAVRVASAMSSERLLSLSCNYGSATV